jgi:hypothetical protein
MKTKLIIALLIGSAIQAAGQEPTSWEWQEPEMIAYFSFAPEDRAVGIRCDMAGGYASISYGNYRLPDGGRIKDHKRIAAGIAKGKFTLGVVYHHYGDITTEIQLPKAASRALSMEAGTRIQIDRFVAALRFDPLRWEGVLDFGITF